MPEEWLTTDEAVAATGYSRRYLYTLASEGKVKTKRLYNARVFEKQDLLSYMAKAKQLPRGGPRSKQD